MPARRKLWPVSESVKLTPKASAMSFAAAGCPAADVQLLSPLVSRDVAPLNCLSVAAVTVRCPQARPAWFSSPSGRIERNRWLGLRVSNPRLYRSFVLPRRSRPPPVSARPLGTGSAPEPRFQALAAGLAAAVTVVVAGETV